MSLNIRAGLYEYFYKKGPVFSMGNLALFKCGKSLNKENSLFQAYFFFPWFLAVFFKDYLLFVFFFFLILF